MSLALPQKKEENILPREQVQYLIGDTPSWMMRYGISMMTLFMALLLLLSYVIKFPDILNGSIILTTSNPPVRVMSASGGRIVQLMAKDQQTVQAGEVLAVMENTANWQDVLRLETWLAHYAAQDALPAAMELGNLQPNYSEFSQHWKDYHYFSGNQNHRKRAEALRLQIVQLRAINENMLRQNALLREELLLTGKEKDRQALLNSEKVTPDAAYEKAAAAWLQQKRQIESAEAAMLQNQMQIQQYENQIGELDMMRSDQANEKELTIAEDVQRLQSAIATWKQTYLVVAPVGGKISLSKVWSAHQNVAPGEEVLAVVPDRVEQIVGKSSIPAASLGKVKQGCRAIVYLDAWPAQQYGAVEGQISGISALPQQDSYLLNVELPDSLVTVYGKTIPFRQEMPGKVHIVTEDRRISDRIFDRFSDLLKNR